MGFISFSFLAFLKLFFFLVGHKTRVSRGLSGRESSTMMLLPPPEIWKRHAVLVDIYTGSDNTKISECLSNNLKIYSIFIFLKSKNVVHITVFGNVQ